MSYDITKHKYKPIKDGFTLADSEIHGVGLFYLPSIEEMIIPAKGLLPFPVARVVGGLHDPIYESGVIRTNGGGFINHSDDPNTKTVHINKDIYLQAIKHIRAGDEITLNYEYSLCGVDGSCDNNVSSQVVYDNSLRGNIIRDRLDGLLYVVLFNCFEYVQIARVNTYTKGTEIDYNQNYTITLSNFFKDYEYTSQKINKWV